MTVGVRVTIRRNRHADGYDFGMMIDRVFVAEKDERAFGVVAGARCLEGCGGRYRVHCVTPKGETPRCHWYECESDNCRSVVDVDRGLVLRKGPNGGR